MYINIRVLRVGSMDWKSSLTDMIINIYYQKYESEGITKTRVGEW